MDNNSLVWSFCLQEWIKRFCLKMYLLIELYFLYLFLKIMLILMLTLIQIFLILSNHTSKMILKMSLYTFVRDLLRHYLWTCELWSMVVWLKASPAPLDDQKAMVLKFTDWRSHCYIRYRTCWTWSSVGLAGLRGGTNPQDPGWKGSELLL